MKYAIVLPDGAADEPLDALGGKTPLEAAHKPHTDWVSTHGRQGCVVTVPDGFLPGSDVATLTLFGYDPHTCYSGRAPLEAAARGIAVEADQLVFRCNFVTVIDGRMADFTAGHISAIEARRLIADLNQHVADPASRFHAGMSYRNLMVTSALDQSSPKCTPPHDIPDQPIARYLPRGPGGAFVKNLMDRAHAMLAGHEVNEVRQDLGENPVTDIWLWGQGKPKPLERFARRFSIQGATIAAVDVVRGIARNAGMVVLDVPGATGYLDTDYAAKGRAAVEALESFDLVVVHVEAPDEAGHQGDPAAKVSALQQIDEHIIGPLLERLRGFDRWRILIAPDHPTPVQRRIHTSTPPPFCMAGYRIHSVLRHPFCELAACRSDLQIDPGHELMEFFLKT